MAWMETDYSKHTDFRWKIKWRLELLGALGIMGEMAPYYPTLCSHTSVCTSLSSHSDDELEIRRKLSTEPLDELNELNEPGDCGGDWVKYSVMSEMADIFLNLGDSGSRPVGVGGGDWIT